MTTTTTSPSVNSTNTNNNSSNSSNKKQNEYSSSEFQVPAFLLEETEISYYEFVPLEDFHPNCDAENPFAAVARPDRLMGKLIDWTMGGAPASSKATGRRRGSVAEEKDDEAVMDEWSLVMVESKTGGSAAPGAGRRGGKQPPAFPRRGGRGGKFGGGYGGRSAPRIPREPSIPVSSEWTLVEEIEFSRLAKLQFAPNEDPRVVHTAGALKTFERSLNRTVTVKNEKPLGALDTTPVPLKMVLEDAELMRLAKEHGAKIVTTDVAVTALMACARSQLPWDLRVWRDADSGLIILDRRESFTQLDFPCICENAEEPPVHDKDHINGASNLAVEAARINAKLPHVLATGTSGSEEGECDRYVLWDLGDDLKMLVRCRINYFDGSNAGVMRALLEYEPGRTGDWRSRLDTQRAAVVANEAKNNSAILSRWLLGAILGGVSVFKLAFVSRLAPRERTKHALLGLHEAEPHEAAFQLGIDVANGFGVLKALGKQLLQLCSSSTCAANTYVLLRDPNKPLIRLYSTPLSHNEVA